MKNKKNNIKIYGLSIVVVIMSLTVANALTGHGIKGNMNLNPAVMATGSNSGTSSWPGEGITGGTGNSKFTERAVFVSESERTWTENEGKTICNSTTFIYEVVCTPDGTEDCVPGTVSSTEIICWTPKT